MKEMGVYRKRLKIVKGEGVYLWDDSGRKYLDAIAGVGVAILGHSHPEIADALSQQLRKMVITGNMFEHEEKEEAMEELSHFVNYEYAFFSNSGTEAVEAGLKFARFYTGKKEIISMSNAFHGRTFGALSATWNPRYREDFKPLVPGFKHIPFNDVESAKTSITGNTAAVIVEVIQGESGVIPASEEFIKTLRDLTHDNNALLIVDEIQTAFRTGKFLASEHFGIEPDIVTLGKGLANGVPIGLTLTHFDVTRGKHGSTFGGNPLACKAMSVTLRVLRRENLIEKVGDKSIEVRGGKAIETRGKGLMLGILLREGVGKYVEELQRRGFLVHTGGSRVLRLLPPLIIKRKEMLTLRDAIEVVLNDS